MAALKNYHHVVYQMTHDYDSEMTRQFKADTWHNMGMAFLRLHNIKCAAECMKRAFELVKTQDFLAPYMYVLELLGVEPEIGAEFTVTFEVDGHETTQTFTLCGWWEYDEAIVANHVLLPESRVDALLDEAGVNPNAPEDGMTGAWNLDVMLKSGSAHIERDMEQILAGHGFQSEDAAGEDYIRSGVNWGYTGARMSDIVDPMTVMAIAGVILLIVFTGYLIIYNVFQISVAGDIRFYGLLKTIGTTPRQLRRIIRLQALTLSAVGIPIGLVIGWLIGGQLTPVIVARLNGIMPMTSVSPWIFVVSAAFALLTVLISCRKPGRMAARVSPVEAVRYTEGSSEKTRVKGRKARKVSPFTMAWANLGRSRGKTAVTVTSLSLAVVLLTVTVNFTSAAYFFAPIVVSALMVTDRRPWPSR